MRPNARDDHGTLRLDLADQIDRVCDRFDAALAADQRPRIQDYLGDVAESAQSTLLRELLAAELHWRRRRGERPEPREYLDRFPAHSWAIGAAFADQNQAEVSGNATAHRPASGPHVHERADATGDPAVGGHGRHEGGTMLRPGAEPLPGYRLIEFLGKGGYGEVWKAEAPGTFQVALKFVPLRDGHGATERRALEIIKRIHHPNLLAIFGVWQEEDLIIIGMELADSTLQDRLDQARAEGLAGIPGQELIEYLAEAAKGIDHLNKRIHSFAGRERLGVQHRDIKPQNILLVGGGVKVADFGLARFLDGSVTGHTGNLTPAYAAPEFFQNQTSDRSDQYCLALTYCMLRGGRLPFSGGAAALVAGHLHQPPDLSMVPMSERPVVARALAKEPARRWPTCRAFVEALRAELGKTTPISPGPIHEPGSAHSRRRIFARVSLAVALLGLGFWVLVLIPSPPPPGPPDGQKKSVPRQPDRKAATEYRDQGARDFENGKFAEAIVAFSEAIDFDWTDHRVFNDRGNAYLELGHFDAALQDYDQAIHLNPGEWQSHSNRGIALFNLKQYNQAVDAFTEAIRLNPAYSKAYEHRALAYEQMGHSAQAASDRTTAAQLDSGSGSSTQE